MAELEKMSMAPVTRKIFFKSQLGPRYVKALQSVFMYDFHIEIKMKKLEFKSSPLDDIRCGVEVTGPIYALWCILHSLNSRGVHYVTDIGDLMHEDEEDISERG